MRWPIGFERRSLAFRRAGGHNRPFVNDRSGADLKRLSWQQPPNFLETSQSQPYFF